ncbi:MAG: DNA polymerase III subunit alpha [Bacteroidales bacterium]|nr:DNA polymerase III subunit alpha [Bacteroidales bacterium]
MPFVHLHVHTQYSILDGAAPIAKLFEKAHEDGQTALAITDHGNMYGVKEFFKYAKKYPDVKPIIGSEMYVSPNDNRFLTDNKEERSPHHLILLAKNMTGYHNLVKLSSYAFIDGFYQKPKIDRELLQKYHEGIICSSACLAGEIPRAIYSRNFEKAEATIKWYKDLFGDDFYLEVQRHKTEVPGADTKVYMMQQVVNEAIFELAAKHGVKVIATNDVHFVSKEDGPAHDRLICLTFNDNYDDPDRIRYTQQEYLKTQDEMAAIFADHPEAITNTLEVAEKVERYDIDSPAILPKFILPDDFTKDIQQYLDKYKDIIDKGLANKSGAPRGEDFAWSVAYLCHLCYKGAEERYGSELTQEQADRIKFELETISYMGFPDYFLIVQDFIQAARREGTWVGPGRGSAAGSVVAYCLHITNIDPLKYDLLFERFLNPDRISMPDIDIDFDDDGRGNVYRYVENKYGKDHISHVATFGTMAAKSAIKDVARIHQVPLAISDRLSKIIPARPFEASVPDPNNEKKTVEKTLPVTLPNCIKYYPEFRAAYEAAEPLVKETIDFAAKLEGSIRQTGVHACATIIGRSNLTDYIPLSVVKDKETGENMLVSQYEGSFIEDVGMLKMDFLGLSTLSIEKECVKNIEKRSGKRIDVEKIPLDDKATYELFSNGDTTAVFQFESDGMRRYLRELKPSKFEDIIAMNALYRPGPMDYIPDFIDRKNGRKPIEYDIPVMEKYLKDTYGITVYQEQVMLLSRELAGFTRGESDTLRKAMGKKIKEKLDALKPKFINGGIANGYDEAILKKIWADWEKFASYAFNKSHSTCYAWVGYQTAWLKANYRAEFMAANMSRNLNDIEELTKLMDDCRRAKINVLGPDINESDTTFTVNKKGDIRFGLGGIKGIGPSAINTIIRIREEGGPFTDIFNLLERVPLNVLNRKGLECMTYAGAFDSFGEMSRAQFFVPSATYPNENFLDELIRYANKFHNDAINQGASLFGDMEEMKPVRPAIPAAEAVDEIALLKEEKNVVGMYLSAHPLDKFKFEIENFATESIGNLAELRLRMESDALVKSQGRKLPKDTVLDKSFTVAGLVTQTQRMMTKNNRPFLKFDIEDFTGSYNLALFGKDYEKFMPYVTDGQTLLIRFRCKERFRGKESSEVHYDMVVEEMNLLSNVKDEFVKEFVVVAPLEVVTADFIAGLKKVCKRCKGGARLYVDVIDRTLHNDVEFFSRTVTVSPEPALLDFLAARNLTYKIR